MSHPHEFVFMEFHSQDQSHLAYTDPPILGNNNCFHNHKI